MSQSTDDDHVVSLKLRNQRGSNAPSTSTAKSQQLQKKPAIKSNEPVAVQKSDEKVTSSQRFIRLLWVYIVRSLLFIFSMLIVLVNHTVINATALQRRLSSVVMQVLRMRHAGNAAASNSIEVDEVVIDQSSELTHEEMSQFAMERGGPISRVAANPLFKTFYIHKGAIRGLIPYRMSWNTVIVLGDPICSDDNVSTLHFICEAFYKYCSDRNYQIVYAASSQEFVSKLNGHSTRTTSEQHTKESELETTTTTTATQTTTTATTTTSSTNAATGSKIPCGIMQFGETLYYKPSTVNAQHRLKGRKQRGLASKLSQAKRCGITVHEYDNKHNDEKTGGKASTSTHNDGDYSSVRNELVQIADAWLSNRKGIQAYLTPIDIFSDPKAKRYFYAMHKNKIVGLAIIMLLERKNGYMIKNVLVHPTMAPKGTSELLVMHVLETLGNEGIDYATFGPGPSPQVFHHIEGFDMPTNTLFTILRACSMAGYLKASSSTYDYRRKYSADKSEPTYLVFYRQGTLSVYNALSILNTFHILASVTDTSSGSSGNYGAVNAN